MVVKIKICEPISKYGYYRGSTLNHVITLDLEPGNPIHGTVKGHAKYTNYRTKEIDADIIKYTADIVKNQEFILNGETLKAGDNVAEFLEMLVLISKIVKDTITIEE